MTSAAQRALAAAMTEAELQRNVIQLAHAHHWLVNHQRPAKVGDRTVTAILGDKGLPDLVLAKDGHVLLAELKTETGRTSPEQDAWLRASGGYLWRPSDWLNNTIHRVLSAQPEPVGTSSAVIKEEGLQAGRDAAAAAILAHADEHFPAEGNYQQQRARRHLHIAARVAAGPPSMDEVRDALIDLAGVLAGTGSHAEHDRTEVGDCVYCSCGARVQGRLQ